MKIELAFNYFCQNCETFKTVTGLDIVKGKIVCFSCEQPLDAIVIVECLDSSASERY